MKIDSIEIENFRNIEKLKLNFEDVNIIWGENAQGKTNLIEAIYLFTGSVLSMQFIASLVLIKTVVLQVLGTAAL